MMETFLVLGLCFILYEALDFFQGCINSATPSTTDQIDAYRRQLDEQRQQQQQEQFLANLTPLLAAQLAIHTASSTPTASTASIISDLHTSSQQSSSIISNSNQYQQYHHQQQQEQEQQDTKRNGDYTNDNHSISTPALHASSAFRPANRRLYEAQDLYATSSLPRDYYYVQQQQLINKTSSKSLLSKFSSGSDNRIFPEAASVLGLPPGVITAQPSLSSNSFESQTPVVVVPPSSLALDLKRAILCNNNNNNNNNYNNEINIRELRKSQHKLTIARPLNSDGDDDYEDDEEDCCTASDSETSIVAETTEILSSAASAGSASFPDRDEQVQIRAHSDFNLTTIAGVATAATNSTSALASTAVNSTDFREIECERLRRKSLSMKRIYSISENF